MSTRPTDEMTAHFAENLSRHGNIQRAAEQLGRTARWGQQQFKKLCGWLSVPVDPNDEFPTDVTHITNEWR